jgi:hypothetical protein
MSRLFTSDGMSTLKWQRIPPTFIPIKWICPSQGYVSIQILRDIREGRYRDSYGGDMYPHVVIQDGVYWLEDGHHRYVIDLLEGKDYLEVRILDNDGIAE